MLELVKQVIDYYVKYLREPKIDDLEIKDKSLLTRKASIFVTILLNGEIRGSSGNIKEIEDNIAFELIKNTIFAISQDTRFKPITLIEAKNIKIRIDEISREVIDLEKLKKLEPLKSGVLVIEKEYHKSAIILPNISNKLVVGSDFIDALSFKLNEEFKAEKYYMYSLESISYKDY